MQFSFWRENSPKFWEVLKSNPLAFFEDDGEISLSRLSSLIANSPNQYDIKATGNAFRFQKIGKESFQNFDFELTEVINYQLFKKIMLIFLG